jgi:hypothetical protein
MLATAADGVGGLLSGALLALLFGAFLFQIYLRPAVQYEVDWPSSKPTFYWSPFENAPRYDAYGFIHKSGWKAIGGLYLNGELTGDYQTNGLTEKAEWYTRHRPKGCYRQTRQYFAVVHRLIDLRELPTYQLAGQVQLPWQKGIDIFQPAAALRPLSDVEVASLEQQFDASATPAAFVRPPRQQETLAVDFAGAAWLRGYRLENLTAGPGEQLSLRLQWQARQPLPIDADVFVHLEAPATGDESPSAIVSQSNGRPDCGQRPTSSWQAGEIIDDLHILTLPTQLPPGEYLLKTGLYLPGDNRRAPVLNEQGEPVGDSVTLTTLVVR